MQPFRERACTIKQSSPRNAQALLRALGHYCSLSEFCSEGEQANSRFVMQIQAHVMCAERSELFGRLMDGVMAALNVVES